MPTCKQSLQDKIKINMGEYHDGRYSSREQAIAVSYKQVGKARPSCRRHLESKRRRKSRNESRSLVRAVNRIRKSKRQSRRRSSKSKGRSKRRSGKSKRRTTRKKARRTRKRNISRRRAHSRMFRSSPQSHGEWSGWVPDPTHPATKSGEAKSYMKQESAAVSAEVATKVPVYIRSPGNAQPPRYGIKELYRTHLPRSKTRSEPRSKPRSEPRSETRSKPSSGNLSGMNA